MLKHRAGRLAMHDARGVGVSGRHSRRGGGFADELDSIFNQCRISVAPLRFGAGIKGKIGTSLCYGVPCVATPIAVEGMDLENGKNILLGSNADDFAEQVVSLYTDEESWKRISSAGIVFMKEHYSFEKGLERLRGSVTLRDGQQGRGSGQSLAYPAAADVFLSSKCQGSGGNHLVESGGWGGFHQPDYQGWASLADRRGGGLAS